MTVNPSQVETQTTTAPSDKELNFRRLEETFNRKIEQERAARQQVEERASQLERALQERNKPSSSNDDDDDPSDEPYVDHKRLKKVLGKVVERTASDTDNKIQNAVQKALEKERYEQWLSANPDFDEVMEHAQKLYDTDKDLGNTILKMPDTPDRIKLVYKTIKNMGLHKKPEDKTSIQDKIDQNKRIPYYQPTGMGAAPYSAVADFSKTGQETAYKKMQELKKRMGSF